MNIKYEAPPPLTCHSLAVAAGIEDGAHTNGVKCTKMTWNGATLTLDDTTIFELGQPKGQLSATKLALIDAEIARCLPGLRRV